MTWDPVLGGISNKQQMQGNFEGIFSFFRVLFGLVSYTDPC